MMRRARLPLAVFTLTFLIACQSDNLTRSIDSPMYAVSDGAHDGNPDFFFLPPLFKSPSSDPNFEPSAFNANLLPTVEICELGPLQPDGTRSCVAVVRRWTGSEVSMIGADQQYLVNWHTDESNLNTEKFYRIRVLVGTTELGFADLDPVSSGRDLKSVQTGEYIGLVDGRTLPIKFRIESGALCSVDGTPCSAGTINLAQGGGVELVTATEHFKFDIPPGTTATYGGQAVTDVTFNLEVCNGIDVDLPTFGDCLRVSTFFETSGSAGSELLFSNPALVSMCVLEPGLPQSQEDFITLHQQDGTLIRALPHAVPNCAVIGARAQESPGFAARGWRWVRDIAGKLFTPRPLYARSRTSLINLGAGGETDLLGATCSPSESATGIFLVVCPAAVAPQLSATAAAAAPTARTVSDFQFALPAKMDYVDPDDASRSAPAGTSLATAVKVTDWNDVPVQGASVTFTEPGFEGPGTVIGTAISNADGIAQVSWPIGSGTNTLVASGRGIAAQNNYPDATVKPFMPDISLPTSQQTAVILRTGEVTFSVTLMGSLRFIQQPTNTVTGEAITPALEIEVLDPSGEPLGEIVRVTVGNDPNNPETCQVLQTSQLALDGVATFSNVIVNGTCTGARVAATAGGGDFDFPIIVSEPFDILPASVTGLLLRYQFDGNANNTGLLSGYNGTATSVTYPEGRFGSAIKFDGTAATGATLTGTADVFATDSKWTISLWFREDGEPKTGSLLWRFRGPTHGWETYHGVTASLITTCSEGEGRGTTPLCFSFSTPATGAWHNVIYRYDGPSATEGAPLEIYVDGAFAGRLNDLEVPFVLVGSGASDIRLGNVTGIGPSLFYVDEFRVYNQVFTVAQQCTDIIGGTWTGESCTMP